MSEPGIDRESRCVCVFGCPLGGGAIRWLVAGLIGCLAATAILAQERSSTEPRGSGNRSSEVALVAKGLFAPLSLSPTITQQTAASYSAGKTLTVTNSFTYTGQLLSLLWRPKLPAGWTLGSVTTTSGTVESAFGEIFWLSKPLPPSPITMQYVVQVPAGESGNRQIQGEVEYQFSTSINPVTALANPNPLAISGPPPVGTVSIVATQNAAEPNIAGTFTVTRSGETGSALTVNYSVGGTAVSGVDYTALSSTVVIAAGSATGTILVAPIDDNLVELSEMVIVTLVAGAGYTVGSPNSATVTIADKDCNYSISPTSRSHGALAENNSLSVTTGNGCAWTANASANWITITQGNSGVGNGTVSYALAANTSNSSRSGTITVQGQAFTITQAGAGGGPTITQQTAASYSAGKTLTVTNSFTYTGQLLSLLWRPKLPAGWTLGSATTTSGTVESAFGEIVWLGATPASPVTMQYVVQVPAGESGNRQIQGEVEYQLSRSINHVTALANPNPLTIIESVAGTPTISAIPDMVILINTDTPLIAFTVSDEQTASANLKVIATSDNKILVPDGTIQFGGIDASNPNTRQMIVRPALNQTGTTKITVTATDSDNNTGTSSFYLTVESPTISTVSIAATQNAEEPNVMGNFTVTRTGGTTSPLTINYSVSGTAGNGVDYKPLTGTLTIPTGSATGTISVIPIDDNIVETDETVVVTLANGAGYTVGSPKSAAVTIADNDTDRTPPNLTITSHINGQTVSVSTITIAGTATDAGRGDNGISSITVNDVRASGDTAIGAATAIWSRNITLNPGTNTITATAKDSSPNQNIITQSIAIIFLPPPGDTKTSIYSNTSAISILDNAVAKPYPATITVSGVTGSVRMITATLSKLNHGYSRDVNILLVGPKGQGVVLMRNAGGGSSGSIDAATLTFSDSTLVSLPPPRNGQVTSGTFKPSDFASGVNLPAPAPQGPYSSTLDVFANVDPNGTWSLFVWDNDKLLSGSIDGGWTLSVSTVNIANEPPSISFIPDLFTEKDKVTPPIFITIADKETRSENLEVTVSSSDETIAPLSGINLKRLPNGGFQLTIRPALGRSGGVKITLKATDEGGKSATNTFALTVTDPSSPINSKGDLDGDGKPDLIFQDNDGFLATWLMNGATLGSAGFLTPSNVGDTNYRIVCTGDFNGNGKEDLLFQHTDGTLAVWYMNGTSQVGTALINPNNPGDRNWRVVAVGDLNRDGKVDIIFQHTDGTLAVWYMNGISLSSGALFNPSKPGDRNWKVVGTGDFNSDGNLDLIFQHTDGTLAAWLLDGIKLTQGSLFTPSNPGDHWKVVAIADLNSDGKPDLLFQHTDTTLAVWFMDGVKLNSAQVLSPSRSGGTWRVVAPK